MEDYLTLTCSFCLSKFRIKTAHAHLRGRCPTCGFSIKAPRPQLYSDRPVQVSDADEPQGLIEEEGEWPEPGVLLSEEEVGDYRLSHGPLPAAPSPPEPPGSQDVFRLGPEYKATRPSTRKPEPAEEPPIKFADASSPTPTKAQSFDEFVAGTKPARPARSQPAARQDPVDADVPYADEAASAKPSGPERKPPASRGPRRPFDPLLDDILVPAPPPPKPEPPKPAPTTGPKFAQPAQTGEQAPPETPAPAKADAPVIGVYNFLEAPPGVSTAALAAEAADEYAHIRPAPQMAPLPEPEPRRSESAFPKAPQVARIAPEPAEVKPASQEELYQYRLSDAERKPYRPPKPPDSPLWTGVWNFAWQASSLRMLVWLVLGFTVLALQFGLFALCARNWNADGGASNMLPGVGMLFIGFSALLVILMVGSYAAACLFKIIEETAAGEADIVGPDGSFRVWCLHFFRLGFLVFCGVVACGLFGLCMGPIAGSLFLLFLWPAVFNTFLLSAMAADSWWIIIHGQTLERLGSKMRVLLALYSWTFVLLGIVMGTWDLTLYASAVFALLAGPALAVCCLTYARVVGRVGLLITTEESKGKKKRKKKKRRPVPSEPSNEPSNGGDRADQPPGVQSQVEEA